MEIGVIVFGLVIFLIFLFFGLQQNESNNSEIERIKCHSQIIDLDHRIDLIIGELKTHLVQCKRCRSKKFKIQVASSSFISVSCSICETRQAVEFSKKKKYGKILGELSETFDSLVYEIKRFEIDSKAANDVAYGHGAYIKFLNSLKYNYYKFDRFRKRVNYQPRIDQISFEI